jgi:hypothetical protein
MSGLPDPPDLDQLRRQARELLRAAVDGDPQAADRLRAVSPRVTLSAAQLALAREYGFRSWAALKADVARRRSSSSLAGRWSFGGTAAVQTPAGVLLPEILIADPSRAILYGSLTLSGNTQPAAAIPQRRVRAPGALLAGLVRRRSSKATRARRASVVAAAANLRALTALALVDDAGARYAFRGGGSSGRRGAPGRLVHLRVHPVPGRQTRWLELRGPDGATTRLLPSTRATARVGQLTPARATAATRPGMPGAVPRADGPQLCCDIGASLPAVDGVRIRLDSLMSTPGSWRLYLCARPRWRNCPPAGQPDTGPVSVRAEDDRGGSYLASYARNTGYPSDEERAEERTPDREELALQFLPRLDPLAGALKLTFQGAHEEIAVDLQIGTT